MQPEDGLQFAEYVWWKLSDGMNGKKLIELRSGIRHSLSGFNDVNNIENGYFEYDACFTLETRLSLPRKSPGFVSSG